MIVGIYLVYQTYHSVRRRRERKLLNAALTAMITHGNYNDQRRSPTSTYIILALTIHAAHDERKRAMHNPCDLRRATTHRHTSQLRHCLKTERPSGERERMSSPSPWVGGRSLEPVRADVPGAAVTPPTTR